jgi:hypothetical protein
MEPRVEYDELKNWVLNGIYDDCRSSLSPNMPSFDLLHSLASIADSYDGVFERPVESLMLAVFFVVLGVNVERKWGLVWREKIDAILTEHSLDDLLAQISEEERFDFTADLRALGVMA